MNEILQLEKRDVSITPEGVEYIKVTDEDHADYSGTKFSKRLKTKNSVRNIPIHSTLKKIGFIDWVSEQPEGRLFPEATVGQSAEKASDTYSKRFRSNLKAARVWVPRRLVFHSFRNVFVDALREAGVVKEVREAINGWHGQRSVDASYGSGYTLAKLDEAIQKVEYPGLRIDHLMRATNA